MDKEIFKQWFGQIVRCAVSFAFGAVVARRYFPAEWAGVLMDSTAAVVTACALQAFALFWGWMKIRYSVFFARLARCAAPETSMREIAREVRASHRLVVSR